MIKSYVKERARNNKTKLPFLWRKQPQKKYNAKSRTPTTTLLDQEQKERTGRESSRRALNLARRSLPMVVKIGIRL